MSLQSTIKKLLDGEHWTYYIGFYLMAIFLLLLYILAITGWTFYGRNVHASPFIWKPIGILIQGLGIYYLYKKSRKMGGVEGEHIALAGALLALGFVAFAGFLFNIA